MDILQVLTQEIQDILDKQDLIIAQFGEKQQGWYGEGEVFFGIDTSSSPSRTPLEYFQRLIPDSTMFFTATRLSQIPASFSIRKYGIEFRVRLVSFYAEENEVHYEILLDPTRYILHISEPLVIQACAGFHFCPKSGHQAFCYVETRRNIDDSSMFSLTDVVELHLEDKLETRILYSTRIPVSLVAVKQCEAHYKRPLFSLFYSGEAPITEATG